MKAIPKLSALVLAILVLGAIGYEAWPAVEAQSADSKERKVVSYQCPMHPWIKSEQPGRCTICGMDLTPLAEETKGAGAADNVVVLSTNGITVLHVQTEEVKRRPLFRTLRVAGTLDASETRKAVVAAPGPGRIEALAVDYAGVEVEKGQRLITLFSPDLAQKTSFFRAVAASQPGRADDLSRVATNPFSGDLVAPISGTVTERPVVLGQYVAEGEKLLTIVDASVLWFRFDVYERQLPWIQPGQRIEMDVPAVPGKEFSAVIAFIEPTINDATRTVKVRADIDNAAVSTQGPPRRLLKFGMYAEGRVRAGIPDALTVPRTAILYPGVTAYAYVDKGGGVYEMRRVKLGRQGDEQWEVLSGLAVGDRVVTTGNVLIDAQAQFNRGSDSEEAEAASEAGARDRMGNAADDTGSAAMALPGNAVAPNAGAIVPEMAGPPPAAAAKAPHSREVTATPQVPAAAPGDAVQGRNLTRRESLSALRAMNQEMRGMRQAAIAKAREEEREEAARAAADGHPAPAPAATVNEIVIPPEQPTPEVTRAAADAVQAYRDADQARRAPGDEKRVQRAAAMAAAAAQSPSAVAATQSPSAAAAAPSPLGESAAQPPSAEVKLTASQRQALAAFVGAADGISAALSGDNLPGFNQGAAKLPAVLASLQKEFGPAHPWSAVVQPVAKACQLQSAKDLADARKQFLLFSTATVEFTNVLRETDPAFAELKTYHCPMAPEPGLWMQAKGPLRNPFYGSKMLTCGEEVKP